MRESALIAAAILFAAHEADPSRTAEADPTKIASTVKDLDDALNEIYGEQPTKATVEDQPVGEAEINNGGKTDGGTEAGAQPAQPAEPTPAAVSDQHTGGD